MRLGERGKFRSQRRNVRHFFKLSVGPRHQAVGNEDAQPGGREKTELSVEAGGWKADLGVDVGNHLGQAPLETPVQRPVVIQQV